MSLARDVRHRLDPPTWSGSYRGDPPARRGEYLTMARIGSTGPMAGPRHPLAPAQDEGAQAGALSAEPIRGAGLPGDLPTQPRQRRMLRVDRCGETCLVFCR